jgi:pilus assembly protein CpaB
VTSARLILHRFRRPIAAASAALAVLILATALRPASPPTIDVVRVSVDLPGGSRLSPGDLTIGPMVADAVPPGALTSADGAVGRTLVGAMAQGEVITATRLMDPSNRADGLQLVPVRLSDPELAELIAPGTLVDLVQSSGDGRGRVVAEAVRVVTVPRRTRDAALGASPAGAGSLIVVATDRRTAIALAAAGPQAGVGVVLR